MATTYSENVDTATTVSRDGRTHTLSASLVLIGLGTVLISAWGGIIPYLGPAFGYSADGSPSWDWTLSHAVLGLVPGAIGLLAGLAIWARAAAAGTGAGRPGLALLGVIAVLCGAWFVIGPYAWTVIDNTHAYFVPASPLRYLANLAGYSLGTGVILVACGALTFGWAARHQRVLTARHAGVAEV